MDMNISAKEYEKRSKYKDLQIEVDRMWQLKISIVPTVVDASCLYTHIHYSFILLFLN